MNDGAKWRRRRCERGKKFWRTVREFLGILCTDWVRIPESYNFETALFGVAVHDETQIKPYFTV